MLVDEGQVNSFIKIWRPLTKVMTSLLGRIMAAVKPSLGQCAAKPKS